MCLMTQQFIQHCQHGEFEKLRALLETQTIDVNSQDEGGCTGPHLAIGDRYRNVVNLLIEHNPSFSLRDNTGYCSLHWAVLAGEQYYLDLVWEHFQEIESPDNSNYRPIHLAIIHKQLTSLHWLMERGANLNP